MDARPLHLSGIGAESVINIKRFKATLPNILLSMFLCEKKRIKSHHKQTCDKYCVGHWKRREENTLYTAHTVHTPHNSWPMCI